MGFYISNFQGHYHILDDATKQVAKDKTGLPYCGPGVKTLREAEALLPDGKIKQTPEHFATKRAKKKTNRKGKK